MDAPKGLYVKKDNNGSIVSVQVEYQNGSTMSVTPELYKENGYQPCMDLLPVET
ncbi:hypothetical protein GOY18_04545 [Aeromonas hydrophila]|uniref:hypothetical protein n=1 Tax=Aeromonas hydrophila TaxID=644 RepID=UPI001C5BF930|nr:hypothetical protein [Aeromonas hydrophila]MBW3809676.1 hypothetical protein [Aeromonas hydrophila]